jgi:hypothetical protein
VGLAALDLLVTGKDTNALALGLGLVAVRADPTARSDICDIDR